MGTNICGNCNREFEGYCSACDDYEDPGFAAEAAQMARSSNPFEAEARAKKVALLVATIDADFIACGMNLHAERETVLAIVRMMGEDGWRAVAKEAGCRPPSKETQRQVVAMFERRVGPMTHEQARRAPLIACTKATIARLEGAARE